MKPPGPIRIFLDANILFSAAKTAGAVRELLVRLRARKHVLCADIYVITEARRNIGIKYPEALISLEELLALLEVAPFRNAKLPNDTSALLPEKNKPVLAAAIGMRCQALVTGDRTHFGALYGTTISGVLICSPRSLAEYLL